MITASYALVTGASQGIGAQIARSLAKRGYGLLLVARSDEKLVALRDELIREFSVPVHHRAVDLSADQGGLDVYNWVIENGYSLSILINNAGYGLWGRFDRLETEDQLNMIDLNVRTLTKLTHYFIPVLLKHPNSYILNVGSLAAYQAVPTLAVYAASKAYVLQFSRALRQEFRRQGLVVSTLNPGPVDTGFGERAGMQALSHLMDRYNMDAATVAERGVVGLLRGKAEIIPGFSNALTANVVRFLPKSWVERIAARLYQV